MLQWKNKDAVAALTVMVAYLLASNTSIEWQFWLNIQIIYSHQTLFRLPVTAAFIPASVLCASQRCCSSLLSDWTSDVGTESTYRLCPRPYSNVWFLKCVIQSQTHSEVKNWSGFQHNSIRTVTSQNAFNVVRELTTAQRFTAYRLFYGEI